jgi:hypothetical protein
MPAYGPGIRVFNECIVQTTWDSFGIATAAA